MAQGVANAQVLEDDESRIERLLDLDSPEDVQYLVLRLQVFASLELQIAMNENVCNEDRCTYENSLNITCTNALYYSYEPAYFMANAKLVNLV